MVKPAAAQAAVSASLKSPRALALLIARKLHEPGRRLELEIDVFGKSLDQAVALEQRRAPENTGTMSLVPLAARTLIAWKRRPYQSFSTKASSTASAPATRPSVRASGRVQRTT